jgi:hypothetical protein
VTIPSPFRSTLGSLVPQNPRMNARFGTAEPEGTASIAEPVPSGVPSGMPPGTPHAPR